MPIQPAARWQVLALAVALAFTEQGAAQVLPGGPNVVNGSATFQQGPNKLVVTNSPGAIINWQSFSIGAGATAQFVQQSAASSVFNRVTGGDPSSILGNLLSNGRVFLINPNGVTIGAGARIDAAAFVASSLGISNTDLLAGRYRFESAPSSANVVNQGTIVTQDGGFVYFVGRNVENSGVIHTPRGEIVLAAGNSVEIINPRSPGLRVEIAAAASEAVNLGKLIAAGGTIGMYAGNVRQKGLASASTAEVNAQGRIVFRAKRDVELAAGSRTEANGPSGGSVTVQAEAGTATVAGSIEARGTTAGAAEPTIAPLLAIAGPPVAPEVGAAPPTTFTVRQEAPPPRAPVAAMSSAPATPAGGASQVPEAVRSGGEVRVLGQTVVLDGNAAIDVSGDHAGGSILVGGDFQGRNPEVQNARFTVVGPDVMLRANAELKGDGGKVVVWADEATFFRGSIEARGGIHGGNGGSAETSGKGYLYFDPRTVNLLNRRSGYARGTLLLDPDSLTIQASNPDIDGAISAATDDLSTGTLLATDYSGAASAITAAQVKARMDGANVSLAAVNQITVAAPIDASTNAAAGDLTLTAASIAVNAAITTRAGSSLTLVGSGAGSVTSLAAGLISTGGGAVSISSGSGGVSLGADILAGTGVININGGGGAVVTAGLVTTNASAAAISVSGATTLSLGAASAGSGGRILVNHSLAGVQTGAVTGSGVVFEKQGGGTLTLSLANTFSGGLKIGAGTLRIGAAGTLPSTGAVDVAAGAAFDLNGFSTSVGALSGAAGASVTSATVATLTIGDGASSTTYAGAITDGGPGNLLSLVKTGSSTQVLSGTNTFGGTVTLAGGVLSVNADANLGSGDIVFNGGTLAVTGNLTSGKAVTMTGAGTVDTGTGVDAILSGKISGGGGALTKAGSGKLTISNATNDYTQGTLANAGTLAAGSTSTFGVGSMTVASGATLDIGAFDNTVSALALNGGTISGTGTLTAASYTLAGGTVGANLGGGILTQTGGTTTLNGTAGATTVNINGGTLALGSADRLANAASVTINSGGTLGLGGFDDTVGTLALNGGTISGTGTLTAASYTLAGGTVGANLGGGTLTQTGGTTTLNGTAGATTVNINGGTLALGSADRLANAAALTINSGGTLGLGGFDDTVGTLALNGGTLSGTGTLTAASYTLAGGTVGANLGGGTLTQTGGTTTLNGTAGATTVNINGGTLALGASDRLANAAALTINSGGTLGLGGFDDTVGTLALNGGMVSGTGTLTAASYTLAGGTVGANLGGGTLTQTGGTTTLNGTAGAATVNINGGTLVMGAADRFTVPADVQMSAGGTLDLAGHNNKVGNLAGPSGGNVILGAGTLTMVQSADTGFLGMISGGGGLDKQGAGALTLGSANTYSGMTRVSAGTLKVASAGALGTAAAGTVIGAGATLVVDTGGAALSLGTEAITLETSGSAGGRLQVTGGSTLTLGAGVSLAGAGSQAAVIDLQNSTSLDLGANTIRASAEGAEKLIVMSAGTNAFKVGDIGSGTRGLGGLQIAATAISLTGSSYRSAGNTVFKGQANNASGGALVLEIDDLAIDNSVDPGARLQLNNQALTLQSFTPGRTIAMGASGGANLGLSAAQLDRIAGVTTLNIGSSAQTGAINIVAATDTTLTGASTVNLTNHTGGINFGADFRVKAGATLNVVADAGGSGAITAVGGGTIFAPTVHFSANNGIGSGSLVAVNPANNPLTQSPLTDTAYLAAVAPVKLGQSALVSADNHGGPGGVFIQANSTGGQANLTVGNTGSGNGIAGGAGGVMLHAANDITVAGMISSLGGAPVTLVAGAGGTDGGMVQGASAPSASVGNVSFTSGGVDAGAGTIMINATGGIAQVPASGTNGLRGGSLTARTFNDAMPAAPGGSPIDLRNDSPGTGNSITGGASAVFLEARRATQFPGATGDFFGNGNIDFRSSSGLNLKGVGTTGNITLSAASYDITLANVDQFQGRNVVLVATGGDITVNTVIKNSLINNNNPGGSLSLDAQNGRIVINQSIGESDSNRFRHALNLNASGDIDVNRSVWLDGNLRLQAAGTVNIANSRPGELLEVRATSVTLGTLASPIGGLNVSSAGTTLSGTAQAPLNAGVLLKSDGLLDIVTTGGVTFTAGSVGGGASHASAAVNVTGSTVNITTGRNPAGSNGRLAITAGSANGLETSAEVSIKAANVNLEVGKIINGVNAVNSDLTITGGTASNGGRASASIEATAGKAVVVGGDLFIRGGSSTNGGRGAIAVFDPSGPMTISAGRGLAIIGGASSTLSGASIVNGGQINLLLNQNGLGPTNTTDLGAYGGLVPSNLILVGAPGSGLYNKDVNDLLAAGPRAIAPNAVPLGYTFAPIRLENAVLDVRSHALAVESAFVVSGVEGIFSPAQPDTPVGIARTAINFQSGKDKNKGDDACP